jgi:cell division protein FtsW
MRALEQRRAHTARVAGQGGVSRRHKPDYWLLILTVALLGIGLMVVYSISPALGAEQGGDGSHYVTRQLIGIGMGLVLFGVASRIPLHVWKNIYMPLLVVAGSATLLTLLLPVNQEYPAHRWIRVGGFSFQSVELLKFALLLWLASFLVYRIDGGQLDNFKRTLRPILFVLVGVGIVVAGLQSDLGSAAVIAAMMVAMVFVAGVPIKRILMIGGIVLIGGILFIATSDYRQDRFATFMNPEADCMSTGYQACQALIAVGSGGMAGLGLGNSVQAYGYLPEAENDSIFAIYAEKFGFIGTTLLLGLMLGLFARIKRVAERAPDDFSRLIVIGILVWLSTQAIINVGAMVGLLPLKGITLPLISYGGSSVLMVLAVLGVVFQVSRYTNMNLVGRTGFNNRGGSYDNSRNGRRFRGAYNPAAGSRSRT